MSTVDLKALRAAADACHGWSWPDRRRDENGTHHFGKRNEDGEFYEIGTIDASNYTGNYADDLRVLKFLRLVQPATIKALIDRLEAAEAAQQPAAARAKCSKDGGKCGIGGYCDNCHSAAPVVSVPEKVSGDVALPKLPKPDHALDMGMQPFYRPDQMHAYARTYGQQCSDAALERAAKVCAAYDTTQGNYLAAAIRALKGGE